MIVRLTTLVPVFRHVLAEFIIVEVDSYIALGIREVTHKVVFFAGVGSLVSIVEEHVALFIVYYEGIGQRLSRVAGIVVTLVELEIARTGGTFVFVTYEVAVAYSIVGDTATGE